MILDENVKAVVEAAQFLTLVTVGADGNPHPIIAGSGKVVGDTIVFGIYKMEATQQNLAANKNAWVLAAIRGDEIKGYRLTGTAEAKDKELIFTPEKAESML